MQFCLHLDVLLIVIVAKSRHRYQLLCGSFCYRHLCLKLLWLRMPPRSTSDDQSLSMASRILLQHRYCVGRWASGHPHFGPSTYSVPEAGRGSSWWDVPRHAELGVIHRMRRLGGGAGGGERGPSFRSLGSCQSRVLSEPPRFLAYFLPEFGTRSDHCPTIQCSCDVIRGALRSLSGLAHVALCFRRGPCALSHLQLHCRVGQWSDLAPNSGRR